MTQEVGARWRACWNGPLRTPKSPSDWQTLTTAVLNDLCLDQTNAADFAVLWANIRQYSHLFGWDITAVKATDLIAAASQKQPAPKANKKQPAPKKQRKDETRITANDRLEILRLQTGGMPLYQIVELMGQKYPNLTEQEETRINLIAAMDRHT
ncbi:MAG: hypothetical protein NTY61_02740 [Candidatus Parcubacteria bacterium]|nr:hypothetical protein [Candidatus Parcubacteria bacterium]